ncbi:MAG: hypothetical protein JWM49_2029 [Microbacteriaceae bacterium]|nr:hypothetical protein [Microbacteriaceae bacterium]
MPTTGPPAGSGKRATTLMSDRSAGQACIEELLRIQQRRPARTRTERIFGASPLSEESRAWYVGALGEIQVGALLNGLPAAWTVFHALPVGRKDSDIDHLVVGPAGVFPINTKTHRGANIWVGRFTVMVNGQKKSYIRNSEHEASQVVKLLVPLGAPASIVRPVIAVVGPKNFTIRQHPDNVAVINAAHLRRWLVKQPTRLHDSSAANIVAHLDRPATWRATQPVDGWENAFSDLHQEVRDAHSIRSLWVVGAAIIAGVIFWNVMMGALH